jgi:hypothetical protein
VLCQRSISAPEGDASGAASLAKTVWGELEQDVAVLGHDVLVPAIPAAAGPSPACPPGRSRSPVGRPR